VGGEPGPAGLTARRTSGVLLHPTALPGPGIGDLGSGAYRFVDWLAAAGQSFWQILPLGPVDAAGSPYNGLSALAGNPLLISPEALVGEGLVSREDVAVGWSMPEQRIDFAAVFEWKEILLRQAHRNFRQGEAPHLAEDFADFRGRHREWLPEYTLFRALRDLHRAAPWPAWPSELKGRESAALERARSELAVETERYAFQQFLFDRQWRALLRYAHEHGVSVIGDLPIFVAYDSADVWANPGLFRLDDQGLPQVVAGVPPDYFSAVGQRWGNPLYRWDVLRADGYSWWIRRFRRTLSLVDVVRIDHFRGFQAYWEIPAAEQTAVKGKWLAGPGEDFFRAVQRSLGELPVIAEDLGEIDDAVRNLRDALGFPGMRIMQFGFDGDPQNVHHPENYEVHCVAYTGTHDNDTTIGWWRGMTEADREPIRRWIGGSEPSNWDFIERVFGSAAALAIVPMQDVLGRGSEARMNIPGRLDSSWSWRLEEGDVTPQAAERLREVTVEAGRLEARV
jgi:4-alpha-glucanotransferase